MIRYGGLDLPKPEVVMLVEIPGNSPEREPETIIAPQGIALMMSRFRFRPAGKKMAVRFQNRHPQSETRFQPQKTQNFRVKSSLKTASLGRSLSWDARRIFFSGSKSRPIEQRICLL